MREEKKRQGEHSHHHHHFHPRRDHPESRSEGKLGIKGSQSNPPSNPSIHHHLVLTFWVFQSHRASLTQSSAHQPVFPSSFEKKSCSPRFCIAAEETKKRRSTHARRNLLLCYNEYVT